MSRDAGYFEEEHLGKAYDIRILKRLLPFVRPYAWLILASMLLVGLITGFELGIPYVTKIAIDNYIVPTREESAQQQNGKDTERTLEINAQGPAVKEILRRHPDLFSVQDGTARISYASMQRLTPEERRIIRSDDLSGISLVALFFLGIIAADFCCNFGQRLIMEIAGQRVMHSLRLHLFSHIQSLPLSFFNRNPVGRLVTRATNDVQNMHEFFTNFISFVLKDLFMLVGIACVLLAINWQLALLSFVLLPLVLVASRIFARKAREIFRRLRIKIAEINSSFSESVSGIRTIQLFLREADNQARFESLNHEYYQAGMRQVRLMALFMPVVEVIGFLSVAIIIYAGGMRVLNQSLSLGALVAFISYIRMFFRPIRDVAEKYNLLQNALASAERIFLILDKPVSEEGDEPGARPVPAPNSIESLRLEGVNFSYDGDTPVLQDIGFNLRRGEQIAFVGPTGSGKTSLINLIVGFYKPQEGRILLNDRDIDHWDLNGFRSHVALVTQEPFLFSGSIRENILQGNPQLGEEQLASILEASNCRELIDKLPQGLDSELGESGASISIGERQLIAVARAFARDPELLILDEATSAIDSQTERMIQQALQRLMQGRTTIIIAHRLSTARQADTIYVMKRGRIVEAGSHQELMAQNGFYARLVRIQNGRQDSLEVEGGLGPQPRAS
jgi:ATP-binding cassette subfamily B protein